MISRTTLHVPWLPTRRLLIMTFSIKVIVASIALARSISVSKCAVTDDTTGR